MRREYTYVYNELTQIVSEFEEKHGMKCDGNIKQLLSDSLNFVMFVVEIEEHFSIYISEEFLDIDNFESMEKLCKLVCEAEEDEE